MQDTLAKIEKSSLKKKIADVRVGDTVRVHQKITEGKKERVQIFEGLVISFRKSGSVSAIITVRKVASGVGVEKSWFVHSPNVVKIQIIKRSKVRRAVLNYMRTRSGKSARMAEQEFDRNAANEADDRTPKQIAEEEISKIEEAELNQVDESTDDVAKQEDKEAAKEDSSNDEAPKDKNQDEKVNTDGNDEAKLPAEEFDEGVKKAE